MPLLLQSQRQWQAVEIRAPIRANQQLRDVSHVWLTLDQAQTKWRNLPTWQLCNSQMWKQQERLQWTTREVQ